MGAAVDDVDDLVKSVSLYTKKPLYLHAYISPFVGIYAVWAYFWIIYYGVADHIEAGVISISLIALAQILTCLSALWSVHIQCFLTCTKEFSPSKATVVKVVPTANNGSTELVSLLKTKDEKGFVTMIWFVFQKTKYIYDSNDDCFKGLTYPVDLKIGQYMDWKGFQDDTDLQAAEATYGKNEMVMVVPKFLELFKERAIAPFFVFQVFCVGLWCLDEYWYYSLFTLFMLVAFECTLVQQQMRNMKEIRKMGNQPFAMQVYRNRKWRSLDSDKLYPGDIVSVGQGDNPVPCDMLLLRGSCIVDESMLTGESIPQAKEPIETLDSDHEVDIEADGKLHVLFGGTKIVRHTGPTKAAVGLRAADNGCIAYVLRTSFNTSQGRLLRTILFGVKRVTANNMESFCFILFLLIFAIAAAAYVWIKGSEDPERNRYKLFLECTLILTSVVPPELPIELSLAVNTSLLALSKLYVFCTEPFRIPFAGKIDICCFDKTGTLTSDCLVVEGVAGLSNEDELCQMSNAPLQTVQVVATCHALVTLDSELVGDPVEKAALNAINWQLVKGENLVVPRKGKGTALKIVNRHHFTSALKRMSVLASYVKGGNNETSYIATVKGAPEVLRNMYTRVPDDYNDVYLRMSRRGARVLALGHREMGALSHQQVRDLTREQLETKLDFAGFIVISCPLKRDSSEVIAEILHSSHKVTMITGDNPLTACHVAKELSFNSHEMTLVFTPVEGEYGTEWNWLSIDETVKMEAIPNNYRSLVDQYNLCITGEGLVHLNAEHPIFLREIISHIVVFARVAPKQKELVITTLNSLGYHTLMCGDGTNDVGALKHAHVGVALLANAPERIPAPPDVAKVSKSQRNMLENGDHGASTSASAHSVPSKLNNRMRRSELGRHNNILPNSRSSASLQNSQKRLQNLLREIDEQDQNLQPVKLGDASIAAPFTSKLSSIQCICHVIKQGRCTLVTTLQMFKILALNALVVAYSQSVLYLDGIKFSDSQATLQGVLLAACFLFISRSKPLKVLSKERPLPDIFNLYTILTVLTQFFVHFGCLFYLVQEASARMPPKVEGEKPSTESVFQPSLLNSTVYIISMMLQISTFAINYKGRPFMESIFENRPLLISLATCSFVVVGLAAGYMPQLADQFEIVEFPEDFRMILLRVLALDFGLSLVVDRIFQFFLGQGKLNIK